jgi:2-dehydropantoate 2-reductase
MRTVAIVGSGALGLYYGARMARAGFEVNFLARGDLCALRQRGVAISYPKENYTLHPARVFAAPEEIGPVDLVVIGLKATANEELARLLPPLLGPDTAVVNLQNGLGVDEAVAAVAGAERTLGALCFVCVNRTAPGVAECTLPGYISLGEFGGGPTARTEAVAAVFRAAGVKTQVAASLLAARWHKLVWNVPFNGLAVAKGGLTTDRILADPMLEAQVWGLMHEVQKIARAEGVEIAEEFVLDQVEKTRPMGPYRPSTLIDWEAGRPLELEPIWGEPLRRARIHGVDTPLLVALHAMLKASGR